MKEKIILTLRDCDLVIMALPPLKEKDALMAAEKLLPAHYPHSLDELVMDVIEKDDQSLVFLIKKEKLEELGERKKGRVEFYSSAQFVPDLPDGTPRVCRWSYPGGQDLYFLRGNRWELALHSEADQRIGPLLSSQFPKENPLVMELDESVMKSEWSRGASGKPYGQRPLFQSGHKSLLPLLFLLLSLVAILSLLTYSFLQKRELKSELAGVERTLPQQFPTLSQPPEEYPWERAQTLLCENLPIDYYTVLELFYPFFKEKAKIMNLSFQGQELYLEGLGSEGLTILKDLKSRGLLNQLALNQIRCYEDRTIFTLSGKKISKEKPPGEKAPVYSRDNQQQVIQLYQCFDPEPDLYGMGQILNREWQKKGLTINQYGERESGRGPFLEYSLEGDPRAFLAFLKEPATPIRIDYLTIDARIYPCSMILGVAPAALPDDIPPPPNPNNVRPAAPARHFSPQELAALFPVAPPPREKVQSVHGDAPQKGKTLAETAAPLMNRLIYIGRVVTGEKGISLGFKDTVSGRIILVYSPGSVSTEDWILKEETDTGFLLIYEKILYEVKK